MGCWLLSTALWAQGDYLSEDYLYAREFVWGINKNNRDGIIGGFVFRYSWAHSDDVYQHLGMELVNVKHQQEQRLLLYVQRQSWIGSKTNYLYNIRLHYGREKILFKKAPYQGVQITWLNSAGPSIGVVAPYYVAVVKQVGNGLFERVNEPYDPAKHDYDQILGPGYLFQGLGESNIELGIHAKTSLSFEFGLTKRNVAGLEFGFMLEAFPNEIPLMSSGYTNQGVFTYFFVTMFYGGRR
ncbi:MAG: hypothetical protein HC842_04930 [Cytophagales bacterium]|nr:hypothetical protein [Cytophagales bacterium]